MDGWTGRLTDERTERWMNKFIAGRTFALCFVIPLEITKEEPGSGWIWFVLILAMTLALALACVLMAWPLAALALQGLGPSGPNWVIVCSGGGKTLPKGGLAKRPVALNVVSQSPSFKAQKTMVKTMFFKKSLKILRNKNICGNPKGIIH